MTFKLDGEFEISDCKTKILIPAGEGEIVDTTDPENPIITVVKWDPQELKLVGKD